MLNNREELWAQIVEVHNEAKTLFLLGEELDREQFSDFIQPINELRHALEHIVRAKANELGLDGADPAEDYHCRCLEKSLGHEYRAFFDCADWISIILREDISRMLAPYDTEYIRNVLPNYYSTLRPQVTEISSEIANLRGTKDISKVPDIVDTVRRYKCTIEELRSIHERIMLAQEALTDYHCKTRRKSLRERTWHIIAALIIAGIVAIGGFIFGKSSKANKPATQSSSSQYQQAQDR